MNQHDDLKAVLREWGAPAVPASLALKIERARMPWWRKVLTYSVPVPVPVAVGLALLMVYGAWRTAAMVPAPCAVPSATAVVEKCGPGTSC